MIRQREDSTPSVLETVLVVATFLALGIVGLANHEMWRDELEIWLIARDSGSVGQLFQNMGTQGHPAVWYLLNFLLARLTTNPVAMQVLNLVIGASAVALFFRRAPFSLVQRLLFCFGYFMLFEFTVISRGYGLGLLLIFAFCTRFRASQRLDLTGATMLLLLANTTVYGMIVAAHVAVLVAIQALLVRRNGRPWLDPRWVASLAIVLLGVAVGFGHTWMQGRAMGPAHVEAYSPAHDLTWVASCLSTVVRGAVPLPDFSLYHFWNSNLLQVLPGTTGIFLGALLTLMLLALATYGFRDRPALAFVFILGSATMLSITFFVWYGWVRHHGQVFLWYIVCCWLWYGLGSKGGEKFDGSSAPGRGMAGATLTGLLLLQSIAGAHAYAMDLLHPFSNAKATGQYLSQDEFSELTLVGSIDYAMQPVAAYLDRKFYYPESGEYRTFLDWGPSRRLVPPETVLRDSLRLLKERQRDVVVVTNFQPGTLSPGQTVRLGPDARLQCLARFDGALVADENYHVCLVRSGQPGPTGGDVDSPDGTTDNYDREGQNDR
jgi:hypothetical protein